MAIDTSEAPKGFYAKLKSEISIDIVGNFCNVCDWRAECQSSEVDLSSYGNRCVSHSTTTNDGREIKRSDSESVIFKRIKQ